MKCGRDSLPTYLSQPEDDQHEAFGMIDKLIALVGKISKYKEHDGGLAETKNR